MKASRAGARLSQLFLVLLSASGAANAAITLTAQDARVFEGGAGAHQVSFNVTTSGTSGSSSLPIATASSVPAETTPFNEFLAFETLTLCPIDTRCLDRSLLTDDDVAWLNAYHATVRERLAPRVSGDARAWLEARTAPIG